VTTTRKPLYDRIRDNDPYVRLYALIELAKLRRRAEMADDLADALSRMLAQAALPPDAPAAPDEPFDECRAALDRYVEFNKEV